MPWFHLRVVGEAALLVLGFVASAASLIWLGVLLLS